MSYIRMCVFLCVLIGSSTNYANEKILASETVVLSRFFESILQCEAGYVFYDKKPMCIIEYFQNSFYFEPREYHQQSTAMCVAKDSLKRPMFQSGNTIFHYLPSLEPVDLSFILEDAFQSDEMMSALTPEESDALNQFFWGIYFR